MPAPDDTSPADTNAADPTGEYIVVARRYRPQSFEELIGQSHVARALTSAIATSRVGHAYLFTGARGVGKTSAARILAKALDCQLGPTPTPCNQCDICVSIGLGSDVDVLEIDGASNRGIDEIRQLRQNVSIRPSRARFKIYIIDEVHMLTKEAFNALLKTLEEPPEHVKFIFCTTEANKIPITILSRCQRFDFAGIRSSAIVERLAQIVAAEGISAEPAALALLARRANGSMRDSQSLLEQLLSLGSQKITQADVHGLLGTAGDARLASLVAQIADRNPSAALAELDAAITEGVDVGQLLEQLLGSFRDCMAAAVGCSADSFLFTSPDDHERMIELGKRLGLESVLAMIQVIEQTLGRLRYSTQTRTLAEMALVRLCSLEALDELPDLIAQLQGAAGGAGPTTAQGTVPQVSSSPIAAKKKADVNAPVHQQASHAVGQAITRIDAPAAPAKTHLSRPLTAETADAIWREALANLSEMLAENAARCERIELAPSPAETARLISQGPQAANSAPKRLAAAFPAKYNSCKTFCERPDQLIKLERALAEVVGEAVTVEFTTLQNDPSPYAGESNGTKPVSQRQLLNEKADHPMIRRAGELFDAYPVRVEPPAE